MKITSKKRITCDNEFDDNASLTDSEAEALVEMLMNDPEIEISPVDSNGFQAIFYAGQMIGLINPAQGMGVIDRDAYNALKSPEITEAPDVSDTIMSTKSINSAADLTSKRGLESAIADALDEDLCVEIVDQAFSADNEFSDDAFIYTDDKDDSFFESLNDEPPRNIAYMFFEGKDWDSKGPANPDRDYFRFNKKGNIESTDNPGAVYMDTLFDEIIDYIMNNLETVEFPEKIDKLISEYLYNQER